MSTPPPALIGSLPGTVAPYFLEAGDGLRYELGEFLVTMIARPSDTDLFAAAWFQGGRGAATPFLSTAGEHQTIIVFDGLVEISLGGQSRILTTGDEAVIPPGTPWAFRMLSHYTRFLLWAMPGTWLGAVAEVGTPVDRHSHRSPKGTGRHWPQELVAAGAGFGLSFPDLTAAEGQLVHATGLPTATEPYFLSAGEGDRRASYQQINSYLSRAANTDDKYFVMHSTGAKAGYIPLHFHQQHTENFLCLEGRVLLHVNGQELLLTKGDFVHAPAGTIHSFAWDSHHTQMVGILAPTVFEKFFEYMNDPTDDYTYAEGGEPWFPAEGFARVQAELDVVVVGPPPSRG